MKFEHFIAQRYLFAKHKINFITIISYLSITGIAIGVAALIVVLSVFNGFSNLITSYLISFDPHIRIEAVSEVAQKKLPILQTSLEKEDFLYVTPFVKGKVLVVNGNLNQIVEFKGIDFTNHKAAENFKGKMLLGNIISRGNTETPEILIGAYLADRMQSSVGDTLSIISPSSVEKAVAGFSLPTINKAVITGIFLSNNNEYDASLIFCSLPEAQNIFNYKNIFQGLEIKLHDEKDAFSFKEKLESSLSNEFAVSTWYDFHKDLYSVMNIERWVAYALLLMIIAVAVFNILGSLSMSVIEKKRDIGILKVKGATEKSIKKIFLLQGFYVGLIGTFAGFALGLLIYYLQTRYKLYPLNPLEYKIDAIPMKLQFTDFLTVGGASILLSTIAAMLPAKRASEINPVDAIKWE
ncbi:MAG: ABC transporter permease [Ignavibacteriaceae bacterium]|nr:ABC transporter permease [Ignavibacteriaceae bacterium]